MAVRTAELASKTNFTAGTYPFFTCPAGKTAIVKDMRVQVQGNTTQYSLFVVRGSLACPVDYSLNGGTFSFLVRTGWFLVLEPGDVLTTFFSVSNASHSVYASGALLSGTA